MGPIKPIWYRVAGSPDKFPNLTQCRLHILKSYFKIDYSSKELPRIELDYVAEEVDSKIEYCILDSNEAKSWLSFDEDWKKLDPFHNHAVDEIGKVYVIQCKKHREYGWKHVYVGSTYQKDIEERYEQHADPRKWPSFKATSATRNMYSEDPAEGLRWDLMTKYCDPYEKYGFPQNALGDIEELLSLDLQKAGFKVRGDFGKYLQS